MSDTVNVGDDRRLADWDETLPTPPDLDAAFETEVETEGSDQPEPEEVPDAVLDE
jgi:hypothetical protein